MKAITHLLGLMALVASTLSIAGCTEEGPNIKLGTATSSSPESVVFPPETRNVFENSGLKKGSCLPLVQTGDEAHSGAHSALLATVEGKSSTGLSLDQRIPLEGVSSLKASVWVKITKCERGTLRLRLVYFGPDGKTLATSNLGNLKETNGEWKEFSISVERDAWPEEAVHTGLYFGWVEEDTFPPIGKAYFDDIALVLD